MATLGQGTSGARGERQRIVQKNGKTYQGFHESVDPKQRDTWGQYDKVLGTVSGLKERYGDLYLHQYGKLRAKQTGRSHWLEVSGKPTDIASAQLLQLAATSAAPVAAGQSTLIRQADPLAEVCCTSRALRSPCLLTLGTVNGAHHADQPRKHSSHVGGA